MTVPDIHRTVDAVWKLESARIVGGLTRLVRDVGLAESLAQDAVLAALDRWPGQGVPDNPGAWLMTVAKRRAVDHLRRRGRSERGHAELARGLDDVDDAAGSGRGGDDDVLRLLFVSCHPALAAEDRVTLTLRLVAGLSIEEIARAFLVPAAVIARRVARAKRTLAEAGVDLQVVLEEAADDRLSSVLEVVYLVFNEGYTATAGADLLQPPLCAEALRLGRLLAELAPGCSEVHGLVALLELQSSRLRARVTPTGQPIPLHEQDRRLWDPLLIRRGLEALLRARAVGQPPGPYVLQAAIAACHAQATSAEATDWVRIAGLYEVLVAQAPSPVVQLNRAVAVGASQGPAAGLAIVDAYATEPTLRDHHHLPSVRGDLLLKLGRPTEARAEFERAAALATNTAERDFLLARAEALPAAPADGMTLAAAATGFLARPDLGSSTRRSYAQTLDRLRRDLGGDRPVASLTAAEVEAVFERSWGASSARTWNRHRAAIRSFLAWAADHRDVRFGEAPAAGLARRTEPRDRVAPLAADTLDELRRRPDLALRERTLWTLLAESGAPVSTVLALDVQDLHLDDRRARLPGDQRVVAWGEVTATLLAQLVAGRTRGPVFLTERRPGPGRRPRPEDRCPDSGRARLSYERAEHLFKRATRDLDPAGEGFTLGRLRRTSAP